MKKSLLNTLVSIVALVVVGTTQTTQAQRRFEIGLRDGVGFASLVGLENSYPHVGLYAGLATNYFFNDRWGLGLDVTLSEQGALTTDDSQSVMVDYIYHYVNVPLVVNYRIPLGWSEIRITAGAQAGAFLLGAYEYSAPSVLEEGSYVEGNGYLESEDFHPYDFAFTLGAQWKIVESPKLFIEARYTHSITQTHDGISNTLNGTYYISVPNNRNSVFQLGTVILF